MHEPGNVRLVCRVMCTALRLSFGILGANSFPFACMPASHRAGRGQLLLDVRMDGVYIGQLDSHIIALQVCL